MTSTGSAPFLYIFDMHSIHAQSSVVKRESKKTEGKISGKAEKRRAANRIAKKTQKRRPYPAKAFESGRCADGARPRPNAVPPCSACRPYHSFASAAEPSIRTASPSGAQTVLQISARRNAPIRAVPPSGAQAAPCKRKTYLEYKKLGATATPQPTFYDLAIGAPI